MEYYILTAQIFNKMSPSSGYGLQMFLDPTSTGPECLRFCINAILCFSLLHQGEEDVDMSATELLYQGILPSLPQYMVSDVC